MTPQPRHIEAANRILDALYYTNKVSWADRITVVSHLSTALAEAENRAAWDGFKEGKRYQRITSFKNERVVVTYMESKYGPRPTKENQP